MVKKMSEMFCNRGKKTGRPGGKATCARNAASIIVASTWVTVIACELFWRQLGNGSCSETLQTLVIADGARPHQQPRPPPRRLSLIGAAAITEAAYLG
jgi:hypothetical protein